MRNSVVQPEQEWFIRAMFAHFTLMVEKKWSTFWPWSTLALIEERWDKLV